MLRCVEHGFAERTCCVDKGQRSKQHVSGFVADCMRVYLHICVQISAIVKENKNIHGASNVHEVKSHREIQTMKGIALHRFCLSSLRHY